MSVFINRLRELSLLNQRFDSPKAEFVVIYSRRRIGKSELIDQFINNRGSQAECERIVVQAPCLSQRFGDLRQK